MTKKPFLAAGVLVLTLLAGAWAVYVLFPSSYPEPAEEEASSQSLQQEASSQPAAPLSASIATADMGKASLVEGITEADSKEEKPLDSASVPSQLSKIKVEGLVGIAPASKQEEASSQEEKQTREMVALDKLQERLASAPRLEDISASGEASAAVPPEEDVTSITMLSAPVKVRLIKSTDEYKEFKKIARGKYPQVDFNKQMVVALESDSNLPDKVFEIQKIEEKDGKILVSYRVNVFGLENKLNTHTVQSFQKSTLPIELKQVL